MIPLYVKLMYQSNRSFNIPPGQPPGRLKFWKILVRMPSSPGQKAVQMPHDRSISGDQMPPSPGKLPDYCFNVSAASFMLVNLCRRGLINRQHEARGGQVTVYLSDRPQVSVVYRLINHAGYWQNSRRICKSRAAGE